MYQRTPGPAQLVLFFRPRIHTQLILIIPIILATDVTLVESIFPTMRNILEGSDTHTNNDAMLVITLFEVHFLPKGKNWLRKVVRNYETLAHSTSPFKVMLYNRTSIHTINLYRVYSIHDVKSILSRDRNSETVKLLYPFSSQKSTWSETLPRPI